MRVQVYRNLHKRCWSIRNAKSRRVIGHADSVLLVNARFKVSEAGRQRVLRERRKNVHAVVEGDITFRDVEPATEPVSYDPYRAGHFYLKATGEAIHTAKVVQFHSISVLATV